MTQTIKTRGVVRVFDSDGNERFFGMDRKGLRVEVEE